MIKASRASHIHQPSTGLQQGESTRFSMKLFRSRRNILAVSIASIFVIAALLAAALVGAAQDVPVFRANVGLVNIFFNVKDKHGALIPNLTKDDFQLFEDGKPQTIKYFSTQNDVPITLGLLIDSSKSMERTLPE